MLENEFRAFLRDRKLSSEKLEFSIEVVKDFESYLQTTGTALEDADLATLRRYVSLLIDKGTNSEDRLVAIARYFYFIRKNDLYIHIAGLVNAIEVLPGIGSRLAKMAGEDSQAAVFEGVEMPPIGSPQESYAPLTRTIMLRMERELSPEKCRAILTWNYHGIPREAFLGHKERFEKAGTVDEFLEGEHKRFIEEITRHMREGRAWYEQEITPEVVDFVEANQEVSIGQRIGDHIFVTKIPCEPKKYIFEQDPRMKRYCACHCPLARTAIRDGSPDIPSTFCYCSAGFTKLVFDVIFDEAVEIEMLESALKGDMRCRFAIKIPEGKMK